MKQASSHTEFVDQRLWLPSHVHVVEGNGAWSVMDLVRSEFILTNPSGGRLLREFREGSTPRLAIGAVGLDANASEAAVSEWLSFLRQALDSNLLSCHRPDAPPQVTRCHLSHASLSLTLELSRTCNLACLHCYNRSGPKERGRLSSGTIVEVLEEVKSLYDALATLTLTGGEPLLYPDLPIVVERGIAAGFSVVRINTNGSIPPKPSLLATLTSHASRTEVQVTLLGADRVTHDAVANHDGSYERLLENTTRFVAAGAAVHLSFTVSSLTEHQRAEAELIAQRLGVPLTINDILPIGRASDNPTILGAAGGRAGEVIPCDETRFAGRQAGVITRDKRLAMLQQVPPPMPCGKSTFAVSSNGDVLPCVLLQGIVVGNIFESPVSAILASKTMSAFQSTIAMDNRSGCNRCELRYACGNKCPAVGLSFGGTLGVKSPFCDYRSPVVLSQ